MVRARGDRPRRHEVFAVVHEQSARRVALEVFDAEAMTQPRADPATTCDRGRPRR